MGGAAATIYGLWFLCSPAGRPYQADFILLTAAFTIIAPWSLQMPSGATFRPGLAMVCATVFLLPAPLTFLVAVPGLVLVTGLSGSSLWKYPLTFGHVAAGLYVASFVYRLVAFDGPVHIATMIPGAAFALGCHLLVNRAISVSIVAHRERRDWLEQAELVAREMNWGHAGLYLLSIATAFFYHYEGPWGLALAGALAMTLYRAVSYYSRMQTFQQAAYTDGLTGVGNRAAWESFAETLRTGKVTGTVAMIDLDRFKAVNDEHGHAVGDQLLRNMAATLTGELRKSDRLFRFGGDEFVLFIAHDPAAEAAVRGRIARMVEALGQGWQEDGYPVTASFGMVSVTDSEAQFDDLFALADQRMYKAKAQGRLQGAR